MKNILIVATFALACLAAGTAHAQDSLCSGKVVIDSVYQTGKGENQYEYFLQIRNATGQPIHWQLNFRNMPQGITLSSSRLSSGAKTLPANQTETIQWGSGSNGNVNTNTVTTGYDKPGANIIASMCR